MLAIILLTLTGQTDSSPPLRGDWQDVPPITGQFAEEERVRSVFDDEMQSPAYKRLRQRMKRIETGDLPDLKTPNWWTRFWNWVGSWFKRPNRGGAQNSGFSFGGFSGGTVVVWILFGILLLILIAFIIKSAAIKIGDQSEKERLRRELDTDAIQPSTPPGEIPSDEYMRRALELAEEGDHRRALRQLVLGGMSWIERAGLIRFRKGLTNRDYIRAIYRREQQRRRFAGIILDFERVYFGRRDATEEQFNECLDRYQNAFTGEPQPAYEQEQSSGEQKPSPPAAPRPSTLAAEPPAPQPPQPDATDGPEVPQ